MGTEGDGGLAEAVWDSDHSPAIDWSVLDRGLRHSRRSAAGRHIQRMQKALTQMNIQLANVHPEEAEKFYRDLAAQGMKVRVGMEASGNARWFERLLSELHFELWIGDAAEIRTKRVRKQKTDRQDAQLILQLMLEDRFPEIWDPSWENRDLR